MTLVILSAAVTGFLHSLSPSHWFPIVLLARIKKWNATQAFFGTIVAGIGHILVSLTLGLMVYSVGLHFLRRHGMEVEEKAAMILMIYGLAYAAYYFIQHRRCKGGHSHHGPNPESARIKANPILFLFVMGFSPCMVVLPSFLAAAPYGLQALLLTALCFSLGVLLALSIATLGLLKHVMRLDHPWLEHYGDVLTGSVMFLFGLLSYFHVGHYH